MMLKPVFLEQSAPGFQLRTSACQLECKPNEDSNFVLIAYKYDKYGWMKEINNKNFN